MDIDSTLSALTFLAALGCGLIAGTFFAFSTFVMPAFSRLPPHEGIAAMQSVNVAVINPWFLTPFLGTAVVCVLLVIAALVRRDDSASVWLLAGGGVYVIGTIVVTGVGNVPMNNALAAFAPSDPAGAAYWMRYLVNWSIWNHVRAGASLAATAAFIMAMGSG